MMSAGTIPERRVVQGAVQAMSMTMTTPRVRSTCRAVRKGPEIGSEQRMRRGNRKATQGGKGKGKGKGKGNGEGKGIVKQTTGADDISRAIALQLQQ